MILSSGLRGESAAFKVFKLLVLVITSCIIIAPLVVMISISFKPDSQIYDFPMKIIPETPTLENFSALVANFPGYIFNSIKLTAVIVLLQLFTATTGAYAFTKLQWKGRDTLFTLYVVSIMIPVQSIIIPQFLIIRNFGLYNTHWALVLTGAFTAFGTFLIKQYFMTIPDSYIEAAHIDGANEIAIFTRVVLPLAKPVIATQVIFAFRFFWNDFFSPLIYINDPKLKTLPLGMSDFVSELYTYVGPQMAAAFISLIPVMIIFIAAQRYFVEGVASSGVKG
jgi:multiple sugar transport system permease protein